MATYLHQEPGVAFLEKQLGVQCRCFAKASCIIHDPDLLLEAIQRFQDVQHEQLQLPFECTTCATPMEGC